MLKLFLIINLLYIGGDLFGQHLRDLIQPRYVAEFSKVKEVDTLRVYSAKFKQPVIEMVKGNAHIAFIKIDTTALEIVIEWNHSTGGKYQFARVPWKEIFTGTVKYGLVEHYRVEGKPWHTVREPFEKPFNSGLGNDAIGVKSISGKKMIVSKHKITI